MELFLIFDRGFWIVNELRSGPALNLKAKIKNHKSAIKNHKSKI